MIKWPGEEKVREDAIPVMGGGDDQRGVFVRKMRRGLLCYPRGKKCAPVKGGRYPAVIDLKG